MTSQSKDPKFYEALKNSQPLAFLASFSIIIGILALNYEDLRQIHDNAIIAGFMFIFSFIMSLVFQIFGDRNYGLSQLARYSKYFFLAVGIFHLLLIAIHFGAEIEKIPKFVVGWLCLVLGGSVFGVAYTKKRTSFHHEKSYLIYDKTGPTLLGLGFLIIGIFALFVTFTGYEIPFDWVWIVYLGMFISMIGVVLMVIGETLLKRKFRT